MADAITAQWHGHNYQSRFFWLNAFDLLRPDSCVSQVTFEANSPKAFDDVVVHYDPPVVRSGPNRIIAEYHQVKWHVQSGGRFGFEDLVDPEFIGGTRYSLLQRLRDAQQTAAGPARFILVTPDRIADADPLGGLICTNDRSLLNERLFDGTKTDRSKMGKVRKFWREHLELADDESLRIVLEGLSIVEGYKSLQELRDEINLKAQVVGIAPCNAAESDFRYDELARQLKIRRVNAMNSDELVSTAKAEGLWVGAPNSSEPMLPIAIRSFLGLSTDAEPAAPENTLLLTDSFRERYLHDDRDWQKDIRPRVESFLSNVAAKSANIRLILDAHASIAYLAGSVLNLKSGRRVELIQKGRVGTQVWRPDDGSTGKPLESISHRIGEGQNIAVALSITQAVEPQVRQYAERELPHVGQITAVAPTEGPGQRVVAGGQHAAFMAEQLSQIIRQIKAENSDALVHLFAACPNSVLFYLGQNHPSIAPVIVYEFDFDRQGSKSYQPSFEVD